MIYSSTIDFAECQPVNYLWPRLVDRLGIDKSQKAARQALDLQRMTGDIGTLPVLLFETCGLALTSIDLIRKNTGFSCYGKDMVLILSTKGSLIQLLQEI